MANTPIYHITAFANLPSISAAKGLHSLNQMARNGTRHCSIAYESVQSKRARTMVSCGPRGCLHDYVPFYFAPRSPMLYAIHKGLVPCDNGQDGVACIVSSAQIIHAAGLGFAFTDGHGIMAPLTNFYDELDNLDRIDWTVMNSRYWNDTAENPDRKRRRQAEFLVRDFIGWEHFVGIGVNKTAAVARVRELLGPAAKSIEVKAKPEFFF